MPRIGLVCEGATDRAAITCYVRQSLVSRGYSDVTFFDIPAHRDKTTPIHGFAMVLAWLSKPSGERNRYLMDLFAGDNVQRCDAILVHLDADNLSQPQFKKHIHKWYKTSVKSSQRAQDRGKEIARLISHVGKLTTSRDPASKRYVIAAAVESTETWCLSAFRVVRVNPEILSGGSLCQEFMQALLAYEGRPTGGVFRKISKDVRRRKRFCRGTAQNADRIERQCHHYNQLVIDLCKVL